MASIILKIQTLYYGPAQRLQSITSSSSPATFPFIHGASAALAFLYFLLFPNLQLL